MTADAMGNNTIDINPEYQREVVWTADRMSQLIDSLMENFYIPPIIFNRQRCKETNKTMLVCVDGKQRLSSVQAFVRGIVPCSDVRGEKWWFKNAHVHGKNKNILLAAEQEEFLNKDFVTFEYENLGPHQEEDLFARVQMGMPLSAAEKIRATTGPWQDLGRQFINDFPVIYSLQKDRMRAKDFQLTLSCFSQILEVQHPTPADGIPMHKSVHTHINKLVETKHNFLDDDLKSHLARVWQTLNSLIELDPNTFTNADKYLKGVQTFAPVEMVAVTVLISVYMETRSHRLLLEDVQTLRTTLRTNFDSLFNNSYMWKSVWSFIDNLDKSRPADGSGQADEDVLPGLRAPPPVPGPAPGPPGSVPAPAETGPKRGRPTARTKPPTVLPGSRIAIKPEPAENLEVNPAEPSQRKRHRTDTTFGTTKRPKPATTSQDVTVRSKPITEAQKLSPFASLGAPVATPTPSKASQRSKNKTSARDSLPTPGPTPPAVLDQGHQNQSSQSGFYRAPAAPMGLEPRTALQQAPNRLPQIVPPVTSTKAQKSSSKAAQGTEEPALASKKQKKKQKQKSIPQYDGVIELSDDDDMIDYKSGTNEEERASLLSAFQGR